MQLFFYVQDRFKGGVAHIHFVAVIIPASFHKLVHYDHFCAFVLLSQRQVGGLQCIRSVDTLKSCSLQSQVSGTNSTLKRIYPGYV